MKVIIAGSRTIFSYELVEKAIQDSGFEITEVVSGGQKSSKKTIGTQLVLGGVDYLGESWAKNNHIPIKIFPAEWGKYGRAAGPIRNSEMADYADALIAVWDGKSRGTQDMIQKARSKGLLVWITIQK